jgi:hypothetical protein
VIDMAVYNIIFLAILLVFNCSASSIRTNNTDNIDSASITTKQGNVYHNVKVIRVEPDGLSVKHQAGIVKLYFPQLSTNIQERYNYNEEEAREYYYNNKKKEREWHNTQKYGVLQNELSRLRKRAEELSYLKNTWAAKDNQRVNNDREELKKINKRIEEVEKEIKRHDNHSAK